MSNKEKQVISKERVTNHGEVLTSQREVNAMLDLVKHETERTDSRFLEPACGTGNFLAEVLRRKLEVVSSRYKRNQLDFEKNAFIAVSSLYGIDILTDNVKSCIERLFTIVENKYTQLYKDASKDDFRKSINYVLHKNIIWGDALTLETVGETPEPIIFSEWSFATGSMIKRREFRFGELIEQQGLRDLPLFSDLGEEVYIPKPVKAHPLVHFLKISDAPDA